MLHPLKTSDTHVFFNINGFCWVGLAKERGREENVKCRMKALVILFLDEFTLNVFLLPRNFDLCEVGVLGFFRRLYGEVVIYWLHTSTVW